MKFKVVFFDCDGVLTLDPLWPKLHAAVGLPKKLDKKWFNNYYSGKIDFMTWVKNIEDFYRVKKLNKELFEKTLNQITMNEEALQITQHFKKRKIKIAIISSGIDYYVKKVADILKVDYWRSNASFHFDRKGTFTHMDCYIDDPSAKVIQVKEICSLLEIKPTETIFVGDSANDLAAFELTKHGVLYGNEKEEYKEKAWKIIKNLNELKYI